MRIWEMKSKYEKYMCTSPVVPFTFEQIHMFNGTSLLDNWQVIKLKIDKDSSNKKCEYPYFSGGIPLASKRAIDVIYPLISDSVELLPFDVEGEIYYGINILKILDVVDYEKSDCWYLRPNKPMVNTYVFRSAECLEGHHIFKVVDSTMSSTPFVSDTFKKLVEKNKLRGFDFKLIWDSDK